MTRYHACSGNSRKIPSQSKGITPSGSQKDFQIFSKKTEFFLWYPRDIDLTLHAYTDVDLEGNVDEKKQ